MQHDPVLKFTAVSKSYGNTLALDKLSFAVEAGQCVCILGPNGAGKTTACELVEGLINPDEGEISVLGLDYKSSRQEILQQIGVHLQQTRLYKKFSVKETLELFASFYRDPYPVLEIMENLSLLSLADRHLEHLSGGQQQRVHLGCALINRPKLLILDEPSLGLDPHSRREVWDTLKRAKELGCSLLLTTHYMEEAETLGDRMLILSTGRKLAEGTTQSLCEEINLRDKVCFEVSKGKSSQFTQAAKSLDQGSLVSFDEEKATMLSQNSLELIQELHSLGQLINPGTLSVKRASLEEAFLSLTKDNHGIYQH